MNLKTLTGATIRYISIILIKFHEKLSFSLHVLEAYKVGFTLRKYQNNQISQVEVMLIFVTSKFYIGSWMIHQLFHGWKIKGERQLCFMLKITKRWWKFCNCSSHIPCMTFLHACMIPWRFQYPHVSTSAPYLLSSCHLLLIHSTGTRSKYQHWKIQHSQCL